MSNYKQLIQKIFYSNDTNTIDSIKKLIYLSVNDSQNFSRQSTKITQLIGQKLNQNIEDEQLKKHFLQLLSEITTNYYQHIPTSYYNFNALINLLSDQNAQVRKASHYLLLIYIKKYEKIDEVLQSYLKIITQFPDHWKAIQKIIHSFQSLLVIEPKCITYGKNYENMDEFLRLILAFRAHHHHLIQKASDQTVSSFVKNQYAPQVLPKLDGNIMSELISYASKINIKLSISKQNAHLLHVEPNQQNQSSQQLQQIKISQNTHKKSKKRLLFDQCLKKIETENDWKAKLDAVQQISNQLCNNCQENDIPEDLIDKILDLTYDYNFKTCITAMNIIYTMVAKYTGIVFQKKDKLEDVVIEKICDLKMAVRQIATKVLKKLYEATPNKYFNKKILIKLSNCSVVGKEEILTFLQQNYKSSLSNDLPTVISDISSQLMNENTRIKIKTIDCLVKLSVSNDLQECKQILQKKLNKVYYDMFLQRLKQKVGNQNNPMIHQNDKNYNKGNMTWQAQRSSPIQPIDKQSLTKVQFGARKIEKISPYNNQSNNSNMIDTIDDFNYEQKSFNMNMKKAQPNNQKKSSSTLKNKTSNTFDTFQSQQTNSNYKIIKKNNPKQTLLGNNYGNQQVQQFQSSQIQEKKAPLKPNPLKRKVVNNSSETGLNNFKEQGLVIQSKEYIDKTTQDDNTTNGYNGSKYSMGSRNNISNKREPNNSVNTTSTAKIEQAKSIPKQPFSIKKSSSVKNQTHQIDYKATYYAAKDQLQPLQNINKSIKQIIKNLPNQNDWKNQFDALNLIRRFIKNHEDDYQVIYQNLPIIMPEVLKLVESLRSTLSKNAMITLVEMCQALEKAMDPFLESIFIKLFKKCQDANTFIVDEVKKCMKSLCSYCSSAKITSIIVMNTQTKAIPVKLKVAFCVDKVLQKKDYDIQCLRQNPKLVGIMNNLIADSSVQVRNLIKQAFELVCRNNSKNQIEQIFKKNSPKDSWDKFKKILDKQCKL